MINRVSPVSDHVIEEILSRVRRKFSMKPKVAIAGFGKSGKSSLFNAIYGQKIASVSMRTDETLAPQTMERFGIDFTDTPGIGTEKFSLDKVIQMNVFDRQHIVIHVLNGASAISADDEHLHDIIEKSTSRRVTVVNKVDILDSEEQAQYAQSMLERLGLTTQDFLFVSAKTGFNIGELVGYIANVLPDAMQDAFIAQQQADLSLKQKRIRTLIYSKAALSAAVGAIPIPIADIFILAPIQIALVTTIGYYHGVEVTKDRAIELLTTVSAGVGLREVARQLIKLVPGYGSAISAVIAFAGTVGLGETANVWFKHQMKIDPEQLRLIFKTAAELAKKEYELLHEADSELKQRLQSLNKQLATGEITQAEFEQLLASFDEK